MTTASTPLDGLGQLTMRVFWHLKNLRARSAFNPDVDPVLEQKIVSTQRLLWSLRARHQELWHKLCADFAKGMPA